MALDFNLHVSFFIRGDAPNIEIWSSAAASAAQYTIPEGTYFFNHGVSAHNIVYQINQLLPSGNSFAYKNDRQLQLTLAAAGRYFRLPTSDDQTVLAEALGLYNNAGLTTYFEANHAINDWICQVTLASCFLSNVGLIYKSHDLYGTASFGETRQQSANGKVSRLATARTQSLGVTWQHVDGDLCRGTFDCGSQATLGTSTASNWSASFDKAFNPLLRKPLFYIDTTDYTNATYYINFEFRDIAQMSVERWNGLFDVAFSSIIYTEDYT